jgi:hypothetical protein
MVLNYKTRLQRSILLRIMDKIKSVTYKYWFIIHVIFYYIDLRILRKVGQSVNFCCCRNFRFTNRLLTNFVANINNYLDLMFIGVLWHILLLKALKDSVTIQYGDCLLERSYYQENLLGFCVWNKAWLVSKLLQNQVATVWCFARWRGLQWVGMYLWRSFFAFMVWFVHLLQIKID